MRRVIIVFAIFLVIGFIAGFLAACEDPGVTVPRNAMLVQTCKGSVNSIYQESIGTSPGYWYGIAPGGYGERIKSDANLDAICESKLDQIKLQQQQQL